ncbi:DUF4123 domain-containing protein [Marinobacter shengliensis]|uniref:DUF4123 domain-containing protein n=1 Tax=Marinobacter shengliensis TaxID=1389223 RepID=UPI0014872D5C|nr:DUF4123 domain-containing protein [Marinobacter shengliensis]
MDAANYISTLDSVAPIGEQPKEASYAIIDLASDPDFMSFLYGGQNQEPIEWWSLFEGSCWQASWFNGPVLVDLRSSEAFGKQVVSRMERRSLGVLIGSSLGASDLLQRSQQWLFCMDSSQERLLRFYEPRMLAALLCVMDNSQRESLVLPDERLIWHDGQVWRSSAPSRKGGFASKTNNIVISDEQLQLVPAYRLAAESRGYAFYYENQLSGYEDPVVWVLERFLEAKNFGFSKLSSLERWLRLALLHGDAFHCATGFHEVLSQEHLSASERLEAMEGMRKIANVTTV